MPIIDNIDWANRIINVSRTGLTLVQASPEIRLLDLDLFRLELKALEASEEGVSFLDTHEHVAPFDVGSVTLARAVKIINGYTCTFEDGQYAVNFDGANTNLAEVSNVNQVSIRPNNSAGLTFSREVQIQSFEGAQIWVDTLLGQSGTAYPIGTPASPVNNLDDALTIATNNSLPRRFRVSGNLTLQQDMESCDFESATGLQNASITLNGYSVDQSRFVGLCIGGTGSGEVTAVSTKLENVSGLTGEFIGCGIIGLQTPGNTSTTTLVNCYSKIPGATRPVIDLVAGFSDDLEIRGYSGGLTLRNIDLATQDVSIDFVSGVLELESTCTAGTVVVNGVAYLIDNSNGTTINKDGLVGPAVWDEVL